MLNAREATRVVIRELPLGKIQSYIEYRDLFVFLVFRDDPFEEETDPFYSVNRKTGKFDEFSILTDGDTAEINALFVKAHT